MQVAIVSVGDELLAGETENTNATWLASQVAARGAQVTRILTVPDEHGVIADAIVRYRETFDAVVVTGGLGGTHDDVTMAAVAEAVDRPLVVDEEAREQVVETAARYQDENPEKVDRYELSFDPDAWAERPAGARVIPNDVGLAPGAVTDDVYVLPGPPEELQAVFGRVVDEFGGSQTAESLRTPMPESALVDYLDDARQRFDVAIGSYPARGDEHNRVKVSGEHSEAVADAADWLRERLDVVEN